MLYKIISSYFKLDVFDVFVVGQFLRIIHSSDNSKGGDCVSLRGTISPVKVRVHPSLPCIRSGLAYIHCAVTDLPFSCLACLR